MPIFKYQRVVFTGPNGATLYFQNSQDNLAVELAEVDGWRYVFVPDGTVLPDQSPEIQFQLVVPTDELRKKIKSASRACQLINDEVRKRIEQRYSIGDEIKLIRNGPSADFEEYNSYAESCRSWGREQKEKIGL